MNRMKLFCLAGLSVRRGLSGLRTMAEVMREPGRFYKAATVINGNKANEFEICLDQRRLKTPLGAPFVVNSELLAMAVAEEWNSQKKTIKRSTMHLTGLCNTTIDNPLKLDVPKLTQAMIKFLETDTICYRQTAPSDLAELQSIKWDPIIDWAEDRFKVTLPTTTGFAALQIPEATTSRLSTYLSQLPLNALFAIQMASDGLKSLTLALAMMSMRIKADEAADLSRLELNYQTSRWGEIEWHHHVEDNDLRGRLAASLLFFYSTTSNQYAQVKKYG